MADKRKSLFPVSELAQKYKFPRRLNQLTSYPNLPPPDEPYITESLLEEYPDNLQSLISSNYETIRTKYRRTGGTAKCEKFCFRVRNMQVDHNELKSYIRAIYEQQRFAFKLQLSFSTILVHKITGEFRLFIGSDNFMALFTKPMIISNGADLQQALLHIHSADWADIITQERENSEWMAFGIVSLHVSLYHLGKRIPMIGSGKHGYAPKLPKYLLNSKNVLTLTSTKNIHYEDNGCFFRVLASSLSNNKKDGLKKAYRNLMKQYCEFKGIDYNGYDGRTSLMEMDDLERCFDINVSIYTLVLQKDGKRKSTVAKTIRLGRNPDGKVSVHADLTNNHLSLITKINTYAKSFSCNSCKALFNKSVILRAHKKNQWCWNGPKAIQIAGGYGNNLKIFDLLARQGIDVRVEQDKYQKLFSVIDIETTNTEEKGRVSDKLQFHTKLLMISAGVSSNIPGTDPEGQFFRLQNSEEELIGEIVDYLLELASLKYKQRRRELQYLFDEICIRRNKLDGEADFIQDEVILDYNEKQIKQLDSLEIKLNLHCRNLVCFGFNSMKFDYKVMRNTLVKVAHKKEVPISYVIKAKTGYSLMKMGPISFRDCRQLLHPNLSLRAYLKSQQVLFGEEGLQQKLYFPYSYIKNVKVLEQTTFPESKHFKNDITGKDIKPKKYEMCKQIFESQCTDLWSYLKIYNLADCKPLCKALEKTREFWVESMSCDILEDGLSVAGLSQKFLFNSVKEPIIWWLGGKNEKELSDAVSKGVIGGVSLVFTRYHEADVTKIRHSEGHPCKKIIGFDCNAMYLRCLGGELPIGIPAYYKKQESGFFTRKYAVAPGCSKGEVEFCLYLERYYSNYKVRHRYREGQLRLGSKRKFSLDAAIEKLKLGFNFHGCYHHRHGADCLDLPSNTFTEEQINEKLEKDMEATDFFEKLGWKVKVVWACQFKHWIKDKDLEFRKFLNDTLNLPKSCRGPYTQQKLLNYITSGEIFGYVGGCDLHFPPETHEKLVDQCPLFQHIELNQENISDFMKNLNKTRNIKFPPRKSLVGGFRAHDQTITTPLLQYYMKLGAIVTNIDLVVQYVKYRPFRSVEKFITEKRIETALDPVKNVLEKNFKLAGNSMFGKLLLRKQDFNVVKFLPQSKCEKLIDSQRFRWYDNFDDNGFGEVGLYQKRFREDTLRVLGFFILQQSKVILLSFLYDFWDHFIKKEYYDILSCDTDCYYFAIAKECLEDMVDPDKLEDFKKAKSIYLCDNEDMQDLKTPGKWKLEWSGMAYIALNSKCCYGSKISNHELGKRLDNIFENDDLSWDKKEEELEKLEKSMNSDRFIAKGVRKDLNELEFADYLTVLENQCTKNVENRGLQWYQGQMRKVTQIKTGLTFDYYKRNLLPGGIRTSCLDAIK